MDDAEVVMLLILIGVIPSWLVHIYIKNYMKAVLLSGSICAFLYPVASWIELGYLDPIWLFGLISGFFWGCAISLFVGIPFWYVRMKREKHLPGQDKFQNSTCELGEKESEDKKPKDE